MTDLEKFQALCEDFGLEPALTSDNGLSCFTFEKPQPKVEGYSSSLAEFIFNSDGSFKNVGVWE